MTIQEAIRSRKPFRRAHWEAGRWCREINEGELDMASAIITLIHSDRARLLISLADVLAEDWETGTHEFTYGDPA
jgi:hypothetical protein